MGKIYYIIGKSASGKDTLLSKVLKNEKLNLQEIVQTTTRPMREGEVDGREYHFITNEKAQELLDAGKVIERRVYHTVHGDWTYMLADDGHLDLASGDYAAVGTVESYTQVRNYFGAEKVVPIYIYVETGERLMRALLREKQNAVPKYAELCRRFLADEADYDDAHMKEAGLMDVEGNLLHAFENVSMDETVQQVCDYILADQGRM